MIICSQDKSMIINFDHVIGIYVKDKSIKMAMSDKTTAEVAKYNTEEKAKQILDEIMQSYIKRLKAYQMPVESVKE